MESRIQRTILSLANIAAPIIANLIMQNEQETLFRNPFNPLQETIDREIKYCDSKQKQFTLIVLKILNVTRILNILGINFFSEYSEFISKKSLKIQNHQIMFLALDKESSLFY